MSEDRKLCRQRTLKNAILIRNDEKISLRCTLKNTSEYGALVMLESVVPVPHEFELLIEADQLIASCKIVWRNGKMIGARAFSGWKQFAPNRKPLNDKTVYERYVV